MKMFVICLNDSPHQILPKSITQIEADKLLEKLRKVGLNSKTVNYYHMHEILVSDDFLPYKLE